MAQWRVGIGPYLSVTISSHLADQIAYPHKRQVRLLTTFFRILEHGLFDRHNNLVIPNQGERKRLGIAVGVNRGVLGSYLKELHLAGFFVRHDFSKYSFDNRHITVNFKDDDNGDV